MRKICIVFTVLMCTSLASASVIGTWDAGVAVADNTDGSGFTGTKYTLTLTSDEGAIKGVDMQVVAAVSFYNEAYRGTVFGPGSGPPTSYDVDTVFLFDKSGLIEISGEDDTTPPDASWLTASNIYSAFSFTTGTPFTSAPVLQVIVPDGAAAPTFDDLSKSNDLGVAAQVDIGGSLVNITPEPATMSLLGLGGLAMLRRRRRK